MKNILLAGYWGFGNVGDEAVASVVIEDIRRLYPDARLILTAEREEVVQRLHGAETVGWRDLVPLADAVARADHVVVGGGGLWNSYFPFAVNDSLVSTSNYAEHIFSLPVLSQLFGKGAVLYAIGAGQIIGDEPLRLAALGARAASYRLVRDSVSRSFIHGLLAGGRKPAIAADPAFRLSEPTSEELATLSGEIDWAAAHRPIVAVLRDWIGYERSQLAKDLACSLVAAASRARRPVLFIPFDLPLHGSGNFNDDRSLAGDVAESLSSSGIEARIVEGEHHPRAIARLMGEASAVLAMRLHGCILSVRGKVPVLGIAYDPKISAVMSDIGLSSLVVQMEQLGSDDVADRLAWLAGHSQAREDVRKARRRALSSSSRGPAFLAKALANPQLLELEPEVADLQTRYAQQFLLGRAAADRRLPDLSQAVRQATNDGSVEFAEGLSRILASLFPTHGEWWYLNAVSQSRLGSAPSKTLTLLDRALAGGFLEQWVWHVKIGEYVRAGNFHAAQELMTKLSNCHPNHVGLEGLKSMLSQVTATE